MDNGHFIDSDVGDQCSLYANWNRCVFNVCLKDCSVRIVLMFSSNLLQSFEHVYQLLVVWSRPIL